MFYGLIILVVLSIIITLIVQNYNLRSEVQENKDKVSKTELQVDNINEVQEVQSSDAKTVNQDFINKFFTYKNTKDRYQNVKGLMTEWGFHSTFPSGNKVPKTGANVTSSIDKLTSYMHQSSKTQMDFMNVFSQTTVSHRIRYARDVYVKTTLTYDSKKGWKVNYVQLIEPED